jgi:hypothetical protein
VAQVVQKKLHRFRSFRLIIENGANASRTARATAMAFGVSEWTLIEPAPQLPAR